MAQTKTTTKKSTGTTRKEQSKELFKNISEYAVLGFRIEDGLFNMFNTLVTAISKNTMSVTPGYRYTVSTEDGTATFRFVINVGKRRYTVHAQANRQPRKSRIVLEGFGPYPFSENGVRKIVKTLKEIK